MSVDRSKEAFIKENTNEILCGDALETLKNFPDESIHCVITSPPYYGLRDYHKEEQIGRETTVEEYLDRLVAVFHEVRRVLKKDGTCFVVIGDSYAGSGGGKGQYMDPKYPKGRNGQNPSITQKVSGYKSKDLMGIPWRLAFALREDGWYLRSDIIWHKENAMPEACRDRPTRSYEHIFLLSKSAKYYYDYEQMAEPIKEVSKKRYVRGRSEDNKYLKEDVWTINTVSFRGNHYAAFPPKLAEICMIAGCPKGGIILDPFIGSGTVGFVALMQDRKYIGIELNEEYCRLARKRIETEVKSLNEKANEIQKE